MSARTSIVNELVEKLKEINGPSGIYNTDLCNNVVPKLVFWDEIQDFPYVSVTAGSEQREYLPSSFKWGFLDVTLRVYVQDEEPEVELEKLLEDIEVVIDANQELYYDPEDPTKYTQDVRIASITTDEGLLAPHGVGEVILNIQYAL